MNYKIGLLVYKCLHGLAPGYLSDQCVPASTFAGRDNMRSSTRLAADHQWSAGTTGDADHRLRTAAVDLMWKLERDVFKMMMMLIRIVMEDALVDLWSRYCRRI